MGKKIIGISGNYMFDKTGRFPHQKKSYVNDEYVKSVIKAGAVPFILPIHDDIEVLEKQLKMVDAVIISGGSDVSPILYGEEVLKKCGTILEERDSFDMQMLKIIFDKKIPVLGICRGMQVMAVFGGGTLYQDLSYKGQSEICHDQFNFMNAVSHKVAIKEHTKLEKLIGRNDVMVNSFHHQAVKDMPKDFIINAESTDGIIEGMELDDSSHLAIAVQWHPEGMAASDEKYMSNLFKHFIKEI